MKKPEEFKKERAYLNDLVLKYSNLDTKRFYNLDSAVYRKGAIPVKYKELMGLVGSMVLRCDECIMYHLVRCFEEKVSDEEVIEAMNIGLIIGGSIVIPHHRKAVEFWENLKKEQKDGRKENA